MYELAPLRCAPAPAGCQSAARAPARNFPPSGQGGEPRARTYHLTNANGIRYDAQKSLGSLPAERRQWKTRVRAEAILFTTYSASAQGKGQARKEKKKKKNRDGGRRQGGKTEDKHSPVKKKHVNRKTGRKKNGKYRAGVCGRSAEAPPAAARLTQSRRAEAWSTATR
jgi:hypothetical protein